MSQKTKVCILMLIVVVIASTIMFAGCDSIGTKRYVGTNTNFDVEIILKDKDTFTITETKISTGVKTVISGTYELMGSNDSIIKFSTENGKSITCEILVNIKGTPFISFAGVLQDYPACYLQ